MLEHLNIFVLYVSLVLFYFVFLDMFCSTNSNGVNGTIGNCLFFNYVLPFLAINPFRQ